MSLNCLPIGTIRTFEYENVTSFCEVTKQWGEFSNMSSAFPVEFEGIIYPTSEHLYIAGRFLEHHSICEDITSHPNAMYCKRKYRNQAYKPFERPDWSEVKVEWMRFVLTLKYQQNPEFKRLLESTGDKIILEDSTMHVGSDPHSEHSSFFWGAKDLARRKAIVCTRTALRKRLKAEGLSDSQIKKQCKELKDNIFGSCNSHYIGANVMGLLLTELRDNQQLPSIFTQST